MVRSLRVLPFLLAAVLPWGLVSAQVWGSASQAPTPGWPGTDSPFAPQVRRLADGQIRVAFAVPAAFALYRDRLSLDAGPGWVVHPTWPAATPDADGHPAYTQDLTVDVPVEAVDPTQPLQVSLRFQGCQVGQLCYPPQTQTFTLPATLTQPTLVVVGTTWCGFCKELERRLLTPAVRAALAGWQVIHIDGDTQRASADRLEAHSYPQLRTYAPGDVADVRHGHKSIGLPADLVGFLKQRPAPPNAPRAVAMMP